MFFRKAISKAFILKAFQRTVFQFLVACSRKTGRTKTEFRMGVKLKIIGEKPLMKSNGQRYNKEQMISALRQVEGGWKIAEWGRE